MSCILLKLAGTFSHWPGSQLDPQALSGGKMWQAFGLQCCLGASGGPCGSAPEAGNQVLPVTAVCPEVVDPIQVKGTRIKVPKMMSAASYGSIFQHTSNIFLHQ